MSNIITPKVFAKNDMIVTNSRDVADYFEKAHRSVLPIIRSIVQELVQYGEKPEDFFIETKIEGKVGFGLRKFHAYDMTQEGFAILAGRFSGPKAFKFQLAYIRQFMAMREELKTKLNSDHPPLGLPDFNNAADAARAWADQLDMKRALEGEIALLQVRTQKAAQLLLDAA